MGMRFPVFGAQVLCEQILCGPLRLCIANAYSFVFLTKFFRSSSDHGLGDSRLPFRTFRFEFWFQIFASCAIFEDRTHGWQGGPADTGDFFIRGSALPSVGRLLHLAEDWKPQ